MFVIYIVCWNCGLEEELGVTLSAIQVTAKAVEDIAKAKGFIKHDSKWYCCIACTKGENHEPVMDMEY